MSQDSTDTPDRRPPLLMHLPLALLPILLIVRSEIFEAPNETPKWLLIVLLGLLISLAQVFTVFCRQQHPESAPAIKIPLIPALITLFTLGILLGIVPAVNPEEAFNRGAYWFFITVILFQSGAASRILGDQYLKALKTSTLISSLILGAWFWYSFLADFHDPSFNRIVRFSRIGHFNFTADVLTCLLPMTLWATLSLKNHALKLLLAPIPLTLLFMVIASGSLGGMGGLLVGALITGAIGLLGLRRTEKGPEPRAHFLRKIIFGLFFLALILSALKPLIDRLPEDYRTQILVRAEWWDAPKTQDLSAVKNSPPLTPFWLWIAPSLGARTPMWAATAGMIEAHPWIGYGTGSYLYEYLGYYKRYDLFVDPEIKGQRIKTNPHNLELQIASENGLFLTVLFLGLFGWLWLRVARTTLEQPTPFWLMGCWGLTAAFLDAQVNHVFYNPGSLYCIALLMGTLYGQLRPVPALAFKASLNPRLQRLSLGVLGLFALALAAQPLRWAISDHFYTSARPLLSDSSTRARIKARTLLEDALTFSPSNVKALYTLASIELMEGHLPAAEALALRLLAVAPNHTAVLNLMADIDLRLGRTDSARMRLQRALEIEPDTVETLDRIKALDSRLQESQ